MCVLMAKQPSKNENPTSFCYCYRARCLLDCCTNRRMRRPRRPPEPCALFQSEQTHPKGARLRGKHCRVEPMHASIAHTGRDGKGTQCHMPALHTACTADTQWMPHLTPSHSGRPGRTSKEKSLSIDASEDQDLESSCRSACLSENEALEAT